MTGNQTQYYIRIGAISTLLGIAGIILAIKLKKGFWIGLLFYLLGSSLGYGIGSLIFTYPKDTNI